MISWLISKMKSILKISLVPSNTPHMPMFFDTSTVEYSIFNTFLCFLSWKKCYPLVLSRLKTLNLFFFSTFLPFLGSYYCIANCPQTRLLKTIQSLTNILLIAQKSAVWIGPSRDSLLFLQMVSSAVAQDGSFTAGKIVLAGSWEPLFLSMGMSPQGFLGFFTAQKVSNKIKCSKRPRKKLQNFLWPSLTSLSMLPLPHWLSKSQRPLRSL